MAGISRCSDEPLAWPWPQSPRSGREPLICLARGARGPEAVRWPVWPAEPELRTRAAGLPGPRRRCRGFTESGSGELAATATSPPRTAAVAEHERVVCRTTDGRTVAMSLFQRYPTEWIPQDRRFRVDQDRVGGGTNPGGPDWWRAGVVEGLSGGGRGGGLIGAVGCGCAGPGSEQLRVRRVRVRAAWCAGLRPWRAANQPPPPPPGSGRCPARRQGRTSRGVG